MELRTVGTAINVVLMAAGAAVLLRNGYRRRREHWSRGSWVGFGLTIFGALALIGFTLVFSTGVDNHAPWVGTPRSTTRILLIVAAMSSMVGGAAVGSITLLWFARGRPTTPFPFARRRARLGAPAAGAATPTFQRE